MKPHQRVTKATKPTLDKKPSGGLEFNLSPETEKALREIESQMDSPDLSEPNIPIDERKTLDPLFADYKNPPELSNASIAVRKDIESRLQPIDIDSLFITGEIRQSVEIIPEKFTVEYRTLKTNEDLYIKRRLSDVRDEVIIYSENRYMLMQLTGHISSINNKALDQFISTEGKIDEEAFDRRFEQVSQLPMILLQKVWVNWLFFQDRVSKAMSPDFLGDG